MPEPSTTATLQQRKIERYLESRDTMATVLLAILLDNYGAECFSWEPESLLMQLKDDFNADLPKINEDKIWGLITAMTTNQFYRSWSVFEQTCKALNNEEVDFSTFSPAAPEDLAWGVSEVLLNDPPDEKMGNDSFSHEIASYVGMILAEDGLWTPPTILSFAEIPVNPTLDLDTAFTDDPEMFEAAQLNQTLENNKLKEYVAQKMLILHNQLNDVPLKNRQLYLPGSEAASQSQPK